MRCEQCQKFVSIEMGDVDEPELEAAFEDDVATVTGEVRIALDCADCGTGMREATFEVSVDVPFAHADGCESKADISATMADVETFDEFLPPGKKRQKHMYGACGSIVVECGGCGAKSEPADWRDSIQSSAMEEI